MYYISPTRVPLSTIEESDVIAGELLSNNGPLSGNLSWALAAAENRKRISTQYVATCALEKKCIIRDKVTCFFMFFLW